MNWVGVEVSYIVMMMQNPLKCSILMTFTMSIIFIFHILVSKNCYYNFVIHTDRLFEGLLLKNNNKQCSQPGSPTKTFKGWLSCSWLKIPVLVGYSKTL